MKGKTATGIVLLTALVIFTAGGAAAGEPEKAGAGELKTLKTNEEKVSYALGVETGRNFKRQGIEVNPDILARGIKDALKGDKLLMNDEDLLVTLNSFAAELRNKRDRGRMFAALDNQKAGEEFLADNKTKEGVVTLPDGLQYKVLTAGKGKKPVETDTVEVNYRGYLIDGTEFSNTESTGAETLKLSDYLHVISGLREALKLMPEGSRWQIFVPPTLAFGQRGSGQYIGPNMTLIYELELVAVK
jgi:FKBP-type peptidyl-prolyl cis-trans isomerase